MNEKRKNIIMYLVSLVLFLGFLPIIFAIDVFFKGANLNNYHSWIEFFDFEMYAVFMLSMSYIGFRKFGARWKYSFLLWSIFFAMLHGFYVYTHIAKISIEHLSVIDAVSAGLVTLVFIGVFLFDLKVRRLSVVVILVVIEFFMVLIMMVSFFSKSYVFAGYKRDELRDFVKCEMAASRVSEYRIEHTEIRVLNDGACISREIMCQVRQKNVLSRGNTLKVCHDKYHSEESLHFIPSNELRIRTVSKYDDGRNYAENVVGGVELTFLHLNSQFILWDNNLSRRFTEVIFGGVVKFLGGQYLTDGMKLYYGNRPMVIKTDVDSFEYLGVDGFKSGCAKDKNNVYYRGFLATQEQQQKCLHK